MPVVVLIGLVVMATGLGIMAATKTGQRQLGSVAACCATWSFWAVQHLAPALAVEVVGTLVKMISVAQPTLLAGAAAMIEGLTGHAADLPTLLTPTGEALGGSSAVGAFDKVAAELTAAIAPTEELTPTAGMGNLVRLFSLNMGVGMESWMLGILGDIASLGRFRSMIQFHDAVIEGLGFRRLGRQMWRAPIQEAITKPLTRYYQELYTQTLPNALEAVKGWYAGVYNDDQYAALMKSAGYDYNRASELRDINQRHISLGEAAAALDAGLITEDALDPLLKAETLGTDRAALVKTLIVGKRTQAELQKLAETARRLYKAGDVTEDEYRQYLSTAHWRDDEIGVALVHDQLAMREEKALTLAELHQLLAAKLITPEDYRARLTRMHYASADIDLLMAQGAKKLSPHQVAVALTQGKLTEEAAQADLIALGYSADDAAAFLALHGKHLSEGQVLEALRNGLLTMDQARADLQALGFDATQVDLLLAFQRKVLSPAEIQAAQLHGALTAEEATARLRALGYSAQDAAVITDLRVRLLSEGHILQAYGDALIPRSTAIADLVERGLSQDEAQTVVTVFDRKQAAAASKRAAAAAAAFAKAVAATQKTGGTPPAPAPGA